MMKYYTINELCVDSYPMICGACDINRETSGSGSKLSTSLMLYSELFDARKFRYVPDNIYNMDGELTLSYRAKELFRLFRLQEGTSFYEVEVYRKKRTVGVPIFRCYMVYFAKIVEVLNIELSKPVKKGPNSILYNYIKPTVAYKDVCNYDLLYDLYLSHICSENVKLAVEEHKLTNFKFTEIEVY